MRRTDTIRRVASGRNQWDLDDEVRGHILWLCDEVDRQEAALVTAGEEIEHLRTEQRCDFDCDTCRVDDGGDRFDVTLEEQR